MYLYGKEVERVQEYKYLGSIFDTTLKFQQNTEVSVLSFSFYVGTHHSLLGTRIVCRP